MNHTFSDPQIPPPQVFYPSADSADDVNYTRRLVNKLEVENAQLDSMMLTLRVMRRRNEASLARHRRSLSAINRTPTEIWQFIFLYTMPRQHNSIVSTSHSPLLLTHVCGIWRRIALDMATLWTSIHIPIITPGQPPLTNVVDPSTAYSRLLYDVYIERCALVMANRKAMLLEWLLRSKTSPLSITVDHATPQAMYVHSGSRSGEFTGADLSIVAVLRAHAARWESLQLQCRAPLTALLLQGIGPADTPILYTISFSDGALSERGYSHGFNELLTMRIFQAPSLRSFRPPPLTDNMTWPGRFPFLGVRTRVLTSLHIPDTFGKISTTEVITLLAECPLLVHLYVYTTCRTPHIVLPGPPPVLLAHLEELTWQENDKESINAPRETSLFHFIITPSLHTLSLQFARHLSRPADVDVPAPLRGLSARSEKVRTISVTMGRLPLTSLQIKKFLQSIPSVEHLELTCNITPTFGDDLFQLLALTTDTTISSPPTEILCPKLKSLTWKSQCPDFYKEAILAFLRTRRGTGEDISKLRKLEIVHVIPRPFEDSVPPSLDEAAGSRLLSELALSEGGVDIEGLSVNVPCWPPFPIPDDGWSPSFGAIPTPKTGREFY